MSKKIVVFGSFIVDLMSRTPHFPQPGETVKGCFFRMGPGGKGFNQGIAAHKSGGEVTMITRLGDDAFAQVAMETMARAGMDSSHVIAAAEEQTGTALILVDETIGQNEIVVVPGACGAFSQKDVEHCRPILESADFVLVQLETNLDATRRVVEIAHASEAVVVLNPAPVCRLDDDFLKMIDIVTPNEVEAALLTGVSCDTDTGLAEAAAYFHNRGIRDVVVTLGHRGVYVSGGNLQKVIPAFSVNAVDTTGAGDAFNGGFLVALAEGKTMSEAAIFGCAVAALSVQRIGAAVSMPTRGEVETFLASRSG